MDVAMHTSCFHLAGLQAGEASELVAELEVILHGNETKGESEIINEVIEALRAERDALCLERDEAMLRLGEVVDELKEARHRLLWPSSPYLCLLWPSSPYLCLLWPSSPDPCLYLCL